MSPHVVFEGGCVEQLLGTDGAGVDTCLVALAMVDEAPSMAVGTATVPTAERPVLLQATVFQLPRAVQHLCTRESGPAALICVPVGGGQPFLFPRPLLTFTLMGLLVFQQLSGEPESAGATGTLVRPILGVESGVILQSHEVRELLEADGTRIDPQGVALAVVGEAPGMLVGLATLAALVPPLLLGRRGLGGLLAPCEIHYRFSQILFQIAKETAGWGGERWVSGRVGGGPPALCALLRIWPAFPAFSGSGGWIFPSAQSCARVWPRLTARGLFRMFFLVFPALPRAKPLAPGVSGCCLPLEGWSGFLGVGGSAPLAALRSMSPHVALEGHGIGEVLATGGTGEKASLVGPAVVDEAPGVAIAPPTLLTAVGPRDAVGLLTLLVGRRMEQFSVP